MSIRVSNLRLPLEEPEANLPSHLSRVLGLKPTDLGHWRVVRKALDTRDKRHLRFVYNFDVEGPDATPQGANTGGVQVEVHNEPPFSMPEPGASPLKDRPVVVGSG